MHRDLLYCERVIVIKDNRDPFLAKSIIYNSSVHPLVVNLNLHLLPSSDGLCPTSDDSKQAEDDLEILLGEVFPFPFGNQGDGRVSQVSHLFLEALLLLLDLLERPLLCEADFRLGEGGCLGMLVA